MKTIKLISAMIVLAAVVFNFNACGRSCDDDDEINDDQSKSIIGTWEIIAWESNEGESGEGIGLQFTFKKDGFADIDKEINVARWYMLKRGDTYGGITLKDDALVLIDFSEEDHPLVFLIKEHTYNTMHFSILEFEMENDANVYSRGTLKKLK